MMREKEKGSYGKSHFLQHTKRKLENFFPLFSLFTPHKVSSCIQAIENDIIVPIMKHYKFSCLYSLRAQFLSYIIFVFYKTMKCIKQKVNE